MSRGDRREDIYLKDIAARLHLGTARNASLRLQEWKRNQGAVKGRQATIGI